MAVRQISKAVILTKITKLMQKGAYEAFRQAGISEDRISKFIHGPKDEFDCNIICAWLIEIQPEIDKFMKFYRCHTPEVWQRLIIEHSMTPFDDVVDLEKHKKAIRFIWKNRARIKI